MATIRVINTKTSSPVQLEIGAEVTTWGALKLVLEDAPEFSDLDFSKCNVYAKDAQSRKSLVVPEEVLPVGDFKVFVTPIQTKGGMYSAGTLKELRTKFNNIIDELLDIIPAAELAPAETAVVDPNVLTEEELAEINAGLV